MNTQGSTNSPLNIVALGWSLSAALVVLFVICLAVALVFPDWRASHGWIGLFSVAPMTSVRVWIDGIVFSIVFGLGHCSRPRPRLQPSHPPLSLSHIVAQDALQ
jgi:hypothetical protein